jgi:hypothetical protein
MELFKVVLYPLLFCLTVFSLAPLAVVEAPLSLFVEGGDCFIFLLNGLWSVNKEHQVAVILPTDDDLVPC